MPLPVLALLLNAFVWGISWFPFRYMHSQGLHPLWGTALMYGLLVIAMLLWRPATVRALWRHPQLWLLVLSAGLTNVAFNWAVTIGDVVRMILLFYLMPAWAVLLAWKFLGEKPTPMALARLALAFSGVLLVMLPSNASWSAWVNEISAADALAVAGGFCFAATNITLRRIQHVPSTERMLAMFLGCMVMGAIGAYLGQGMGWVTALPAFSWSWAWVIVLWAVMVCMGNWALQFGASRLPSGTTSLIMLSEVVFASVSSVLIAHAELPARTLLGGALVMSAAVLAAQPWTRTAASSST